MALPPIKGEATLKSWRFVKADDGAIIVLGTVYGHWRIPDGHRIHTSRVVNYNPRADVVETLHTFYKLEDA